ncbi:hypothetical protein B0I37DRAFT_407621 [Chaetomium sp. MPI-CAGE-AT-0009]|nr:hypothetical protein B0I37DRAFT_407621 [Chaetomium sp. MPI-CAGE-AT-0009]
MQTDPSTRRRKPSLSLNTPQRGLGGTVGVHGGEAAPAATDEQSTDSAGDGRIKGQAATAGMGTDISATNTVIYDPRGNVPKGLAKSFSQALVLLAFLSPFMRLPVFVWSAVRPVWTFLMAVVAALSSIFSLLGSLCQDLLTLLGILHPVLGPLKVIYQDVQACLGFLFCLTLRLFNAFDRHLPTSLRAFLQALSRWLMGLPEVLRPLFYPLLKPLNRIGLICRWLLIAYTAWLGFTYTATFVLDHSQDALSTVLCATAHVSSQLVVCQPPGSSKLRGPDLLARIALPRGRLADAARRAGRDHPLARQMLDHHNALRDLTIRAEISGLLEKDRLVRTLTSLMEDTDTTAQLLSDFTASINHNVDIITNLDERTIKVLYRVGRDTEVQPQEAETLLNRVVAMLHPLVGIITRESPRQEVKRLLMFTAAEFEGRIDQLLDEADALLNVFHNIYVNLGDIKAFAMEQLGKTSGYTVLQDLWDFITRKMDVEAETKGHRKLLGDITRFYDVANGVVRDVRSSLLQAKAEMKSFNIARVRANTLLEEYPPHIIAATLQSSMEKLDASRLKFEGRGTRIAEAIVEKQAS